MLISIASTPALNSWHDISAFPNIALAILAGVIATIFGLTLAFARRRPAGRSRGRIYTFPKQKTERDILHALGKASELQIAILKFIVDGYLEGVDPAEVAAHFRIKKTEAAKHLTVLHRLGLLYIKRNAGGKAIFYLLESAMARIGAPRFFDLIGLATLA